MDTHLLSLIGTVYTVNSGIRPVVTLNSKVVIKDSGTMKDGCKLYNMEVK